MRVDQQKTFAALQQFNDDTSTVRMRLKVVEAKDDMGRSYKYIEYAPLTGIARVFEAIKSWFGKGSYTLDKVLDVVEQASRNASEPEYESTLVDWSQKLTKNVQTHYDLHDQTNALVTRIAKLSLEPAKHELIREAERQTASTAFRDEKSHGFNQLNNLWHNACIQMGLTDKINHLGTKSTPETVLNTIVETLITTPDPTINEVGKAMLQAATIIEGNSNPTAFVVNVFILREGAKLLLSDQVDNQTFLQNSKTQNELVKAANDYLMGNDTAFKPQFDVLAKVLTNST